MKNIILHIQKNAKVYLLLSITSSLMMIVTCILITIANVDFKDKFQIVTVILVTIYFIIGSISMHAMIHKK